MLKISVDEVVPGAVIAKDIYAHGGTMLVSKGSALSLDVVKRLEEMGIQEVFIKGNEIDNEEVLDSYQGSFREYDIIYEKTRYQAHSQIKKVMTKLSTMNCDKINVNKITDVVEDIIEQLISQKDILLTLSRLRSIDKYTYEHSVNVCILSLIVGIDLHLDESSLKTLGIGSILHDVGKVGVPESILNKPYRLTSEEFQQICKHTDYGYEILMKANVPEEAAQVALHHHEKYDGTGYNRKLKGDDIPLFSRIVAVADAYDAMSNDRVYKKKMSPDIVFREIARLGAIQFDEQIMEKFLRHLSLYPVGTGVILNTNHKGVVIKQNRLLPESPVIRVFKREKGSFKIIHVDIDLSLAKYLFIKETF